MIRLLIILTAILAAAAQAAAGEAVYRVRGTSMAPTLAPGDRVVVQEAAPETLHRGDLTVIAFRRRPAPLVKRAVALPGDRLAVAAGRLRVNGADAGPLDPQRAAATLAQLDRYGWVVPPATLLVLGDNSANSRDSRRLGLIPFVRVKGKVVRVIPQGDREAIQQQHP